MGRTPRGRSGAAVAPEPEEYDEENDLLEGPADLGPWEPPSETAARFAYVKQHYHHELFSVTETKTEDLAEFGEGLVLYFYFLRWMALLFGAMTLVAAIPNLVYNTTGAYTGKGGLEATTLGEFGPLNSAGIPNTATNSLPGALAVEAAWRAVADHNATLAIPLAGTVAKARVNLAASMLDLAAVGLYCAAGAYIIFRTRSVTAEVDDKTVTIGDYSVHVTGLPADAKAEEVHRYFEQWGALAAVELARNDSALIGAALARGRAEGELAVALARARKAAYEKRSTAPYLKQAESVRKRLQASAHTMARLQAQRGEAQCVCAFVTYKEDEGKTKCMKANPASTGRRLLQRKDKRFGKRFALIVRDAPEPGDVLWENLEFTSVQRFGRRAITGSSKWVALAVGFLLICITTATQSTFALDASQQAACNDGCSYYVGGTLELNEPFRSRYTQCAKAPYVYTDASTGLPGSCPAVDRRCYNCYCVLAMTAGKLAERTYCSAYLGTYAKQLVAQLAAVAVVLVTNQLLQLLATSTTTFERHHTRSQQQGALAQKLFLAQFINTALSVLVANCYLPVLSALIPSAHLRRYFLAGIYGDTIPAWYTRVGRGLIITMLITGGLQPVWLGISWWGYKRKVAGRCACVTQEELNSALEGPEFQLAYRYAGLLNVVYVTMMFSSGLPLLYPIACATFAVCYWGEKWELLKLSRVPPQYTSTLAIMAGELLPYAALWHFGFAAWTFSLFKCGGSAIAPDSMLGSKISLLGDALERVMFGADPEVPKAIGARVLQANAAPHTIAFFALLILLIVKMTYELWVAALHGALSLIGFGGAAARAAQDLPSFAIAVRARLMVGPTSYSIKANPQYAQAFAAAWAQEAGDRQGGGAAAAPAAAGSPGQHTKARPAVRTQRSRHQALTPARDSGAGDADAEGDGTGWASDAPNPLATVQRDGMGQQEERVYAGGDAADASPQRRRARQQQQQLRDATEALDAGLPRPPQRRLPLPPPPEQEVEPQPLPGAINEQ